MKSVVLIFCICLLFSSCYSEPETHIPRVSSVTPSQSGQSTSSTQNQPVALKGDDLRDWMQTTLDKYSQYPDRNLYPKYTLPFMKMTTSGWSLNQSRYARGRFSGIVKEFGKGSGFVALGVTSDGMEEFFFGKDNPDFFGIGTGDYINAYVNYIFERTPEWMAIGTFVEMVDILDKPNAQEWVYEDIVYTRATLQEALRITRNEANTGNIYNFWTRNIDYAFAAGYFLFSTGTTQLSLVEYYGEDLESRSGHGGVLYNIDCSGIIPKVTAIKFLEYQSRR